MDILQLILSFLSKEQSFGKYQKIFDLLKENSFDIPKTIKNADLTSLAPVFMDFLSQNKNSPMSNSRAFIVTQNFECLFIVL